MPQAVATADCSAPLRRSPARLASLRNSIHRLPSVTSSHRYFLQRVEGFDDVINTTLWLSTLNQAHTDSPRLSDAEKDMALRFASYQTAQEMARRIMNPTSSGDTMYAVAAWEQLITMAGLSSDTFSDIQPLALEMKRNIQRYFGQPGKLGFASANEQRKVTRRFDIMGEIKPRRTFQL